MGSKNNDGVSDSSDAALVPVIVSDVMSNVPKMNVCRGSESKEIVSNFNQFSGSNLLCSGFFHGAASFDLSLKKMYETNMGRRPPHVRVKTELESCKTTFHRYIDTSSSQCQF